MRSWILALLFSFFALLSACGVKSPPLGLVREKQPSFNFECSPYDPNCDQVDPDYVSGLDPNKPEDAKKIRALEAARLKKLKK